MASLPGLRPNGSVYIPIAATVSWHWTHSSVGSTGRSWVRVVIAGYPPCDQCCACLVLALVDVTPPGPAGLEGRFVDRVRAADVRAVPDDPRAQLGELATWAADPDREGFRGPKVEDAL